jgi:hypothetical protein
MKEGKEKLKGDTVMITEIEEYNVKKWEKY